MRFLVALQKGEDMSLSTNAQPLRSRAERRHRQHIRDATRPALRIVPTGLREAPRVSAPELVADLAALIDAGLVEVARDDAGEIRYDVVDSFGGDGAVDLGAS